MSHSSKNILIFMAFVAGFAVASAWRRPLPVAQASIVQHDLDLQSIRAFCHSEPITAFKANLSMTCASELIGQSAELHAHLLPYAISKRDELIRLAAEEEGK